MKNQKVIVKSKDNKKTYIEVSISSLSSGERVNRSVKKLGVFWLIALVTAFIPVLHFFLVPTFLILGLVMFFLSFNVREVMVPGECECPECKEQFELEETNVKWPISQICTNCCQSLELLKDN